MKAEREGGIASAWVLPSGTWTRDAESGVFSLRDSALGNTVSSRLTQVDVAHALAVPVSSTSSNVFFPPEFSFDPATGVGLDRAIYSGALPWVAPHGAKTVEGSSRAVRGLPQSSIALSLQRQHARRAEDAPDQERNPPPPGHYEFFSVPAGTVVASLLAIDPSKGHVHVWFDRDSRWEVMAERGGGMLAETRIHRADWRAEAASDALTTRIFLSTEEGLACLVPDAIGLSFSVSYHGGSPALGSPVQFGERVWAPVLSTKGGIKFVGLDLAGGNLVEVEVGQGVVESSERLAGALSVGRFAAPVTNLGDAIWVSEEGQLLLQRKSNGTLEGSFQLWPASVKPALAFGSPYLARDGLLWQLCLDKSRDHSGRFIYALLGRGAWETWDVQPPRLCSGTFNFRFATKHHTEPWIEPEHGDDGASDEVVVPVVESVGNRTVIGMKFKSTKGVEMLLSERERTPVRLVVDDADRQTEFDMFTVAQPLQLRVFVHDAHLWAYHPALPYLRGWAMGS